ncbi:sigma-54 interaction domain-containing protein [Fictibacillus terranigra]|uniref:Sigma 54-interacting transcriptional regulator n=1 Tax=Fictibacillus terranigra TaxID=3058424 RepID=A0ABT8EAU8_9BACL|nr:sigma 54-interacting transcriptional regulator [Fictibacillus sp. CENA-BCM004]MDN4075041.1 sigma 54-interacting transcriptional regulator [Fictibacillus sp. CENA-BCM004]
MTDQIHNFKNLNLILKRIIDEIDVGLHVVDEKGNTIIYNQKMMQIESMDIHDVLDKNLLDVFRFTKEGDSTLVLALQEGKETRNVKQTYFNNKGKEITTINNTFPVIKDGEITGAVEIAKDVTKLERLIRQNISRRGNARYTFESIIGSSPPLLEVIENAKRATRTSSSVLIVGETGTGKELFAQSIHNGSIRSAAPFISQNCAALPDNLIESLLFGTKKGAFTGATEHPGLFEQAEGGTLLLDEINSLNPNLQAKLLRVLQEKTIRRIGDTKDTPINVRIIATINEDPIDAIANQHLRKDLFYRLGVVTLFIPPLRDRKADIPQLAKNFVDKYNELFQMNVREVDEQVMESFLAYEWPGNVRELEHVIEGAMNLIINEDSINYSHLPFQYRNKSKFKEVITSDSAIEQFMLNTAQPTVQLKEQMDMIEKYYIQKVLKTNKYNISATAKHLGISRQSLQYRMKKFNLQGNEGQ